MVNITISFQAFILFIAAAVALFLTAFTVMIKFSMPKMKAILIKMELCTVGLLLFMALSYVFDGIKSPNGFIIVSVINAVGFLLICFILYCYIEYLTVLYMSKGRFNKLPDTLKNTFKLCVIWMLFSCLAVFTDRIYIIDENNYYKRGDYFYLASVIPLVIIVFLTVFIIQNRSIFKTKFTILFVASNCILIAGTVIQMFRFGDCFFEIAIFLVSVALYVFTLMEQNEELQLAAYTELKSGLPNAHGFFAIICQIIQKGNISNYNAYYFDVVGMGSMNNKYGDKKANEILISYIDLLRNWFEKDDVLGRLGGDFFVALVKKERTEEFMKVMSDSVVNVIINGNNQPVHVSSVVGGYKIDDTPQSPEKIMSKISTAISYAKNVSKERFVFIDDEIEKKLIEEKRNYDNILKGLENGEFVPYYQPKVNTETFELCGCEALVRWLKDGELIPPYKFIPLMERTDLICNLDLYMLEHVCRDIREWLDEGLCPPCVSVNLSRKNLNNENLAEDIHKIVSGHNIPVSLIQIEITETNDAYPLIELKKAVDKLHGFGFSVAIDDFGTGSSSINLLKEVSFDELKIDKTFIDYADDKEQKLLSYIIEMAKAIDINVIAEGVEEPVQVESLINMECTYIQGYVFDKPLEKHEYEDRIRRKKYPAIIQ